MFTIPLGMIGSQIVESNFTSENITIVNGYLNGSQALTKTFDNADTGSTNIITTVLGGSSAWSRTTDNESSFWFDIDLVSGLDFSRLKVTNFKFRNNSSGNTNARTPDKVALYGYVESTSSYQIILQYDYNNNSSNIVHLNDTTNINVLDNNTNLTLSYTKFRVQIWKRTSASKAQMTDFWIIGDTVE